MVKSIYMPHKNLHRKDPIDSVEPEGIEKEVIDPTEPISRPCRCVFHKKKENEKKASFQKISEWSRML